MAEQLNGRKQQRDANIFNPFLPRAFVFIKTLSLYQKLINVHVYFCVENLTANPIRICFHCL